MVKRFFGFELCAAFAHLGRVLAIAAVLSTSAAQGQLFGHHAKDAKDAPAAELAKPEHPASQPAAFTIPVEPLGFFAPGAIYQGQRESLVSLDFLDEDHLLFTFHAPGLIRREGNPAAENEREIRAMVLTLPTGTVDAEALWTVHDRGRYLWMLNGGHFFFAIRTICKLGMLRWNLSLRCYSKVHCCGWRLDPAQDLIATDSREPVGAKPQAGTVPSPATASAWITIG